MSKENAAACTNKQKKLIETEKQTTQKTTDDEGEQATISASSQNTLSEDRKPQTLKEEGKLSEEQWETNEEEKRGDEKMEVDPCPETAASSHEKGKCSKLNELSLIFRFCLMLFVNGNLFPPSTELCHSLL